MLFKCKMKKRCSQSVRALKVTVQHNLRKQARAYQIHFKDSKCAQLMLVTDLDAFQSTIEQQVLSSSQRLPQQVMLRADAHHGVYVSHVCADVQPLNFGSACPHTTVLLFSITETFLLSLCIDLNTQSFNHLIRTLTLIDTFISFTYRWPMSSVLYPDHAHQCQRDHHSKVDYTYINDGTHHFHSTPKCGHASVHEHDCVLA